MSSSYFWLNIILLAVGTLMIRSSILLASSRVNITPRVKEIFSYIPAAVLPALAAPMVFYHEGVVTWLYGKERMMILVLATVIAFLTRKMTFTLVFGIFLLYLLTRFS